MTMKPHVLLALALVLAAFHARAAVTITPASPTSADAITAAIDVTGGCGDTVSTSITGNTIRTDILQLGCFGGPTLPVQEFARFGPLAPGTYTYNVYINFENTGPILDSSKTIIVAPSIPTIGEVGLFVLALSLAGIACFALGKHSSLQ